MHKNTFVYRLMSHVRFKKCRNGGEEIEDNALCVSAQKYMKVPGFIGQFSNSMGSRGKKKEEEEEV